MKTILVILVALSISTPGTNAQTTTSAPDVPYVVVDRGANHRVWQRTTYEITPAGQKIPYLHKYTELATGMHYQKDGQWVESKEEIQILPDGTAAATQGRHQAYFPGDIYQGVIGLRTPDGKLLQSRPLGLSYDDGTQTVLIAELKDSVGQLVGSNQVVYPDAFTDFKADLRYKYTKAGFEQDIVLHEQPAAPESYGLNPQTARLQVLTEFFDTPEPQTAKSSGRLQDDLGDTTLTFGAMKMTRGRAFSTDGSRQMPDRVKGAPVAKSWQHLEGRTFLVEELPVQSIEPDLQQLPVPATADTTMNLHSTVRHKVSAMRLLPPSRLVQTSDKAMRLAKTESSHESGLVLDYVEINTDQTNFTFQGDTTYLVNGEFNLVGSSATLEGGTVIKFDDSTGPGIHVQCPLIFKTGRYQPAVFTSMDDNSVGEVINGSSGSPTLGTNTFALILDNSSVTSVSNLRFSYSASALTVNAATVDVWDCQFINCGDALVASGVNDVHLHNVLCSGCGDVIDTAAPYHSSLFAEQLTADVTNLCPGQIEAVNLTNCIIIGTINNFPHGVLNTNHVVVNPSGTIFQTIGGGSYYLTNNSSYRNAGATSISSNLLAELRQKTTYPPIVYSNLIFSVATNLSTQVQRDTNVAPDLGYHYDPVDYALGGCDVYAGMTVASGTVIGWFETDPLGPLGVGYGISLSDGGSFTSQGTVTRPCYFVRYDTVQEGGNGNWAYKGLNSGIVFTGDNSAGTPTMSAEFVKWYHLANDPSFFRDVGAYGMANVRHCEFYNGSLCSTWAAFYFANCLFTRTAVSGESIEDGSSLSFNNCTFWNGAFSSFRYAGQDPSYWLVQNSVFDGTSISTYDELNGDTNYTAFNYNAYLHGADQLPATGTNNLVITNSFNWQSNSPGAFYLPAGSALINAGSTTADNVGLYQFTTQTNQLKETNSIVDLGYHYVALGTNGNPLDTNTNGIADYLEDDDGDGIADSSTNDFYNGVLPGLVVISGNNQSGPLGSFLPLPLTVQVTNSAGTPLVHAPLTFSVTNGLKQLAIYSHGPMSTSLSVRTGPGGYASVYLFLPTNAPVTNLVFATAYSGSSAVQVTFTGNEGLVTAPVISPAGGTFATMQNVAISCATTGAVIHYTLNGNDPTETDPVIANGQTFTQLQTVAVKARAFEDGVLLPSPVQTANFTITGAIAAGRKHTLALRFDGTVLAGGSGGNGQLGDGTTHLHTNLVDVLGVSNVLGIAAGELFSYAWKADGTAWTLAWGDDRNGEMGNGTTMHRQPNAIQINNLSAIVGMSAGNHHGLAVDTNGWVWAWGLNNMGQVGASAITVINQLIPMPITNFAGVVAVAAGSYHSLALKTNGTVWAWGHAFQGELGDGTTPKLRTVPVQTVGLTNVTAIAAGKDFSLAISNGTVWQWGTMTKPGYITIFQYSTPTKVTASGVGHPPLTNIVAIAAGMYHALALKSDGTVWAWGYDDHGQAGNGGGGQFAFIVSGLSNAVAVAAGGDHSVALKSDGTIALWGYLNYGQEANYSYSPIIPEPYVHLVWTAPIIVTQPANQTLYVGDTASFTVTARGKPFNSQWKLNGSDITGSTNTTLILPNVQTAKAGNYTLSLTNQLGSVLSSNAVLTVLDGPVIITAQPANQTEMVGATASFSVVAKGTLPLSYQWNYNGVGLPGATNATLFLPNVQFGQAGSYSVTITNSFGTTNSVNAVLTVSPAPAGLIAWWRGESNALDSVGTNNGTLVNGAGFATGVVGQAFSFNGTGYVSVPNAPLLNTLISNITIEAWIKVNQFNSSPDWNGIVTKGNSSWRLARYGGGSVIGFSTTGLSQGDLAGNKNINDGQWHHVAAVYDGTNKYIYVDGALDASAPSTGSIAQNSYPVCIGENAEAPGHLWNGLIDEASLYNRALTASEIQAIYNAGGTGKNAQLPAITVQPTNQIVFAGSSVNLSVTASGSLPLNYQWTHGGTNIVWATASMLTLDNVQFADAGNYAVLVTNPYGSILSSNALLTVIPAPPIITGFTPVSGFIGTTVTISGTNFGAMPSNNIVYFGAVQATVTSASVTNLMVTVPAGATYAPITVTVNGLAAYASAVFEPTFPGDGSSINSSSFASRVDLASITGPGQMIIADFDGDGKPDLAVNSGASHAISVYRNISTAGTLSGGSFATRVDFSWSTGGDGYFAVADVDGDGKLDLVFIDASANQVAVLRNVSTPGSLTTNSFAARVNFSIGSGPRGVAVQDLDGDGKPEIVAVNYNDSTVSVLRNIGTAGSLTTNSFAPAVTFATGTGPQEVMIADVDGDSKADLVTVNVNGGTSQAVSVLRNLSAVGNISFAPKVDLPGLASSIGLAIGDLDGDGKLDLVVSSFNLGQSVSVYRNVSTSGSLTTNSFAARVDFAAGGWGNAVAIGDVDGDGKPDVAVVTQLPDHFSLFKNVSAPGSFTTNSLAARVDYVSGSNPLGVAIGDLDGDGRADVVFADDYSATVSIYQNVMPFGSPPYITTQPTNQTLATGVTNSFTVVAGGTAPLSYQWYLNSAVLPNAINATLTITNVQTNNVGYYFVVVSNLYGTATSSIVGLSLSSLGADSDYDGRSDAQEAADGTSSSDPNSVIPVRLGYWPFDNTNTWVGSAGQLPLTATNIVGFPSWSTNALLVDSTNAAFLCYRDVEPDGNANINCRQGAIRFWFSPDWSSAAAGGTGPGVAGRLIEMGRQGTNTGWWALMLNTNGNALSFVTQTNGVGMTNLNIAISWNSNIWHQVVLSYGTNAAVLYLDGQAITNGAGVQYYPSQIERANGFRVGGDATGTNQARGIYDELETFNYALTATDIATNYNQACDQKGAGGNSHFSIRLLAPKNNVFYTEPAKISIQASVVDLGGTVSSVGFFQGPFRLVGTATVPYQYAWPIVAAGQYSLTAVAHDVSGLAVTSAPVSITVTNLCSY